MKKTTKIILAICLLLIVIVPLITIHPKDEEEIFGGADGAAEKLITELDPNYEPWFSNLVEPPSSEIESLLFCLQAAIGAGIVGYGAGYLVGKKKGGQRE